jgi:dihydroxyacid dehydratase/phosphogluconate dehydratase
MTTTADLQAELDAARARITELATQNIRLRNLHRRHVVVVNAAVNWLTGGRTNARAELLADEVRTYLRR